MIIDKISNLRNYAALLPCLNEALDAVDALPALTVGKYAFDGGFFMVQQGLTKPFAEGSYEAHRKFIDVQILVDGCEELAWQSINDLQMLVAYDDQKDVQRFLGQHELVLTINPGMFYAVFPEDGHQPVSHTHTQHSFTKIVLKLPTTYPDKTACKEEEP